MKDNMMDFITESMLTNDTSPLSRRLLLIDHMVSSIAGFSSAIILFGSMAHSQHLVTNTSDVDLIVLFDKSDLRQLIKCSNIERWVKIGADSLFKHEAPVYASKKKISKISVVLDFISTSQFESMCNLNIESNPYKLEYNKVVSGPSRKTFTMGSFSGSRFIYKPPSQIIDNVSFQHHIDWIIKDNELYIGLYPEVMLSRSIILFEKNQGYVESWLNKLWSKLASRLKKETTYSSTTKNLSIINAFTQFYKLGSESKMTIATNAALYSGIDTHD